MEAVQTRQMRTIPSLSQLDRKRVDEAKERWERNRNATVIAPAETPRPVKPTLTAIPPKSIAAASVPTKLRVAAYCRVSTGSVEQETSIENQRAHFEKMINANPDWEMADVYWEAAVSGTKKDSRPELQEGRNTDLQMHALW